MDIASAKEQIKNTIRIYLLKDEIGEYRMPVIHQRPIFLLGAPGLGKTSIMQQIAEEMGIGLVSYSMTHHTRQSALGLPMIVEKEFEGKTYSVSEYTMSEIIASVYECMRRTGKKEGILFLDEINCVSETLAPSMLLFLQYKVFGGHQIPEGWVVITAGNQVRFNKSVREFDAATRDRLKVMEIEPNYDAWKKYAIEQGLSRSIISYLDIRPDDFYQAETTVEGLIIVTPRAWEDLSEIIQYHEELKIQVNIDLISQYIQNSQTARDFALYYELYQKYRQMYCVEAILDGNWDEGTIRQAKSAKTDEKMSLVSLLLESVFDSMKKCMVYYDALNLAVRTIREDAVVLKEPGEALGALAVLEDKWRKKAEKATKKETESYRKLLETAGKWHGGLNGGIPYNVIGKCYKDSVADLKEEVCHTQKKTGNMLKFLQEAFGKGTEVSMAVNDLTVVPEAAAFIGQFLSEEYFDTSREMLLFRQEEQLLHQIDLTGVV